MSDKPKKEKKGKEEKNGLLWSMLRILRELSQPGMFHTDPRLNRSYSPKPNASTARSKPFIQEKTPQTLVRPPPRQVGNSSRTRSETSDSPIFKRKPVKMEGVHQRIMASQEEKKDKQSPEKKKKSKKISHASYQRNLF